MDGKQSEFKYTRNDATESISLLFNRAGGQKYHISVPALGQLSRTIGDRYPNASEWGTHLYRKNFLSRSWMREFQKLVQELSPDNSIDWDSTERYYDAQDERAKK